MRVLSPKKNFLAIAKEYSKYDSSGIVILSAPYEHSVSYGGGTAKGPSAIIEASHYVEFWDEEFKRELCFDIGIATLAPLSFSKQKNRKALNRIEQAVTTCLHDGKFVVTLGGEHTISAAPIRAHFEKYPSMSVLQFDAHSDLRDSYQGSKYSHASVMARVAEFVPADRIVQIGIRAQCIEEYQMIVERGIRTCFASDIHRHAFSEAWQNSVLDMLNEDVYITFDVDYFDPSLMPATGTTEPGGFQWAETVEFIKFIGANKRIIGFDVVELAPSPYHPSSAFTTAKLVYKMLNAAFQHRQ